MNFDRVWTKFALSAEYNHFGMSRIARAHNMLLTACLEAQEAKVREAFRAGFMATVPCDGTPTWAFDGPSAADREPEAWVAWCELEWLK